jgi:hypothetical protein
MHTLDTNDLAKMEMNFFVDISVALYCYTIDIPCLMPPVNFIDQGFDRGAAFAVARWKFR